MLVVTVWALSSVLEIISVAISVKVFFANLEYTCYAIVAPILWFALTLQYIGRCAWLTRRRLSGLCGLPAMTFVLAWTNDAHGLVRRSVALD